MRVRGGASGNELLYRLPADEAALLTPFLQTVPMAVGDLVCEAGAPIRDALFPNAGMISLLGVSGEGSALELALIGREGLFGVPLFADYSVSPHRAVVQGEGSALRIKASNLRRVMVDCPSLRSRVHRYGHRLTTQIAQTALCNCFHSTESRIARWMLSMSDRMQSDGFVLTQALLAVMLGVLRPTVNHAARQLSVRGLVSYRRGHVRILDRAGLEAAACSCYPVFAEHDRAGTR